MEQELALIYNSDKGGSEDFFVVEKLQVCITIIKAERERQLRDISSQSSVVNVNHFIRSMFLCVLIAIILAVFCMYYETKSFLLYR